MSATQVIIVRHGQTEWNVQGRMQGHLDSPLTAVGIKQAEALAVRLSQLKISTLYCSDLGRARQTAEIIAHKTGHPININARLRERKLGVFQGLTRTEIEVKFPDAYAAYLKNLPDYRMDEGESLKERFGESVTCLEELASRHDGETILVVTHGGVLNAIFRHALSIPMEARRRFKLLNASLNMFIYGRGNWNLVTWGDVSHLEKIGAQDDI